MFVQMSGDRTTGIFFAEGVLYNVGTTTTWAEIGCPLFIVHGILDDNVDRGVFWPDVGRLVNWYRVFADGILYYVGTTTTLAKIRCLLFYCSWNT